jgi:hypothetical protein
MALKTSFSCSIEIITPEGVMKCNRLSLEGRLSVAVGGRGGGQTFSFILVELESARAS